MNSHYDVIIIGGGPAGLTAAMDVRRAGRTVLLLEKESFGGQIAASPRVENYPGLPSVSGAELADRLFAQTEALGARIELEEVREVRNGVIKTVVTDYGTYTCAALILATGMKHKKLGLPKEDTLRGISFCAVCDGSFYQGQNVAVCGGGNTALQEALFLSDLCRRVTVIHRRDSLRGDPILSQALQTRTNVSFVLNSVVAELLGESELTGLRLRNRATGEEGNLPVSGLFEAVGQAPERTLAAALIPVDDSGFVLAGEDCLTPASGVFVAGDCRTKEVRQLTTACADGAVAAAAACRFCREA
jgi:thioredoxin reductase (NADPH)